MAVELEKLGFRAGLEIHQRVDARKLFCDCYSNPGVESRGQGKVHAVERRLRAVVGELGVVDRAAAFEAQKGLLFNYLADSETSCLVELDDEPPRDVNAQALEVAVSVAKALKCRFVDEVHVMRKTVVDGSAVSGFQRTACIARNGLIDSSKGQVGIQTVCVEEEAAGIVEKTAGASTYRLDRLGIPLIEIATEPLLRDGRHAAEVAGKIGSLLRATGKVQRGIGTIRQDLNVSITGGSRVEIKGAQDLAALPALVENEALRQSRLLEVRDALLKRGVQRTQLDVHDVTSLVKRSASPLVQKSIAAGGVALAVRLQGFGGVLKTELMPGHGFGAELAAHARAGGRVGGLVHSDEDLPAKYGMEPEVSASLFRGLAVSAADAFMLVIDSPLKAEKALRSAFERAMSALEGAPPEVSKAEGEKSVFLRPMPGAQRMYPETDVPPLSLTGELLARVERPETPEEIVARLHRTGLNQQLASKLASSTLLAEFEELHKKTKADATVIATTLLETLRGLSREGLNTAALLENGAVEAVLRLFAAQKIARAAIEEVLRHSASAADVSRVVREKRLERLRGEKLKELLHSELEAAGGSAGKAFGEVMRKHRLVVDAEEARVLLENA